MISFRANNIAVSVVALGLTANLAFASPLDRPVAAEDLEPERVYSPYADRNYPDEILCGGGGIFGDADFVGSPGSSTTTAV